MYRMELGFPKFNRDAFALRGKDTSGPVKIYLLVDPRDSTVRYVGKTRNPDSRSVAHRSIAMHSRLLDSWKVELRERKLRPLFEIVDSCEEYLADKLERSWITYYRNRGRLHNVSHGGTAKVEPGPSDKEVDDALRRLRRAKNKYAAGRMTDIDNFLRTK